MNGVQILLVVGAGIAISAFAKRRGLEPGLFIVVLAAAASFLPGVPRLELDSDLILAIVVPPLLYSATRGVSFSSFGANLQPILALGVLLVLATTAALGLIASWLLPSIGLPAAFTLGAVLAPPDTITTVSHGDELGLPRRATAILTGESLVNDATALTLFSIAVAAVAGQHTGIGRGVGEFLQNLIGGVIIGAVFATVTLWIRKRLGNPTLETALVLLVPFAAYLTAEEARSSGILAVVTASFGISANLTLDPRHQYPGAYRTRLQEDGFWPVVDFLLETFVFAYIGLQLKFVLEDLAHAREPGLGRTLVAAGVLLAAAIVLRMIGAYGFFGWWRLQVAWINWRLRRDPDGRARFRTRLEAARRPADPEPGAAGRDPAAARGRRRPAGSAHGEGDGARRLDRHARHPHPGRRRGHPGDGGPPAVPGPGGDPGDRAHRHPGNAADPGHHAAVGRAAAAFRPHRRAAGGSRDERARPGARGLGSGLHRRRLRAAAARTGHGRPRSGTGRDDRARPHRSG